MLQLLLSADELSQHRSVFHPTKLSKRELNFACRGTTKETRGTAYVVYEDIYDAKAAVEHLSGFNVANRYLICLFYGASKRSKKVGPGCMLRRSSAVLCQAMVAGCGSCCRCSTLLCTAQGSGQTAHCSHV